MARHGRGDLSLKASVRSKALQKVFLGKGVNPAGKTRVVATPLQPAKKKRTRA